jgi:hypothetical protein
VPERKRRREGEKECVKGSGRELEEGKMMMGY